MKNTPTSASPGAAAARQPKLYPMPLVRVDLVVFRVNAGKLQVLLGEREEPPFAGRHGLPGGVLRIDLDASLEEAALRVGRERLRMDLQNLALVTAVGGADRDMRAPWAMSLVYRTMVTDDFKPEPGKRVRDFSWELADKAMRRKDLAFDHALLIGRAVDALRQDLRHLRFSPGGLPSPFTLAELQGFCEAALGEPLDKVTFRRRIAVGEVLEELPGQMRTGAHRPAQLYRLKSSA